MQRWQTGRNMTNTNLQEWIAHPELLNRETLYELRNILARFPFFQTVRLLYLKNLYILHDASFGQELKKAALYISDRRVLFYTIEGEKFIVRTQSTDQAFPQDCQPGLDRTLLLIDAFLSTLPEELSQESVFDVSADYTACLLEDEVSPETHVKDIPKMNGQELIDGFIEKAVNHLSLRLEPVENEIISDMMTGPEEPGIEDDESCFTETLAKIYVKQKRYSKALEIIKKLSLKYPKKNAYFADQIRFLEKLIINTKSK